MWRKEGFLDKWRESTPNRVENCRKASMLAYKVIEAKGFYNTKPEILMASILDTLGVDYLRGYPVDDIIHCYHADFYIERYNLIIEVDGRYWHNYPGYRELDLIRNQEILEAGYRLLRFWEDMFDIEMVDSELKKIHDEVGLLIECEEDADEF
jgi:very-short-patch-repair endonuclease